VSSKRLKAFFWVFALFLVQNALNGFLPGKTPPLLAVGVVFFALTEGPSFGLAIGCFAGVFLELFAVGKLGAEIAAMGSLGALCGFASTKLFRDSLLTQLLLPASALALLSFARAAVTGQPASSAWDLAWAAAVSPFLFAFLKKAAGGR
jgi:cell shape-determining protein MreD